MRTGGKLPPIRRIAICVVATGILVAVPVEAAGKPSTRALIISGLSMDPKGAYARNMRDWTDRFSALLKTQGMADRDIRVLAETSDAKASPPVTKSTRQNIRAAFAELAEELGSNDQFVLVMLGMGTVTDPVGKLCIPGPDLTATELARHLKGLPTDRIVIINCASGGSEFLAKYGKAGRVVVSACGMPGQGQRAYFAEFFLLAHETRKADADKDGYVTVLEAFNYAGAECINWYHRQYQGKRSGLIVKGEVTVNIRVTGRETCRLFKKFYDGTSVRMDPKSDARAPDTVPETRGRGASWVDRRESPELASLEDQGTPSGVHHWVGNKHVVLAGKAGEQGEFARRTVLGNPALFQD